MKRVIASWGICNTASLNVYGVYADTAIVGINDQEPEEVEILYSDEYNEPYIDFYGTEYYLNECMSV